MWCLTTCPPIKLPAPRQIFGCQPDQLAPDIRTELQCIVGNRLTLPVEGYIR